MSKFEHVAHLQDYSNECIRASSTGTLNQATGDGDRAPRIKPLSPPSRKLAAYEYLTALFAEFLKSNLVNSFEV